MSSERPDGRKRTRESGSTGCRPGSARTAGREVGLRAAGTHHISAPRREALQRLARGGELDPAEKAHFALELDAELLERTPARLGHEREGVDCPGVAGGLDEVFVARRDLSTADPMPLEAAGLEHSPRRELVLGIFEDAAARALIRRLRGLPLLLHAGDSPLALVLGTRLEPNLDRSDDLAVAEA